MATRRRPATEAEARTLASAIRLRILRLCLDQALTNKEIAGRLRANPATTLHHVRMLVSTGFLDAQPERRGTRGAREIPYLATGKSWTLDISEGPGPDRGRRAMIDAFLEEVALVDDQRQIRASRLGLRLTAEDLDELSSRIDDLMEEFKDRRHGNAGRPYSMFLALHPDVGRDSS